jgi:hypothetical protein
VKKKGFDAVAFQRKRREAFDRETEGMTWEERHGKIMKDLENDPLWKRLKHRVADLRTLREFADAGKP